MVNSRYEAEKMAKAFVSQTAASTTEGSSDNDTKGSSHVPLDVLPVNLHLVSIYQQFQRSTTPAQMSLEPPKLDANVGDSNNMS